MNLLKTNNFLNGLDEKEPLEYILKIVVRITLLMLVIDMLDTKKELIQSFWTEYINHLKKNIKSIVNLKLSDDVSTKLINTLVT